VDFLNVGPWELVLVLIIAILVAGPKRMVEIARTLGQYSRQLRDLSREFTTALQAEIQATEEEAGKTGLDLREVQKDLEDVFAGSPVGGSAETGGEEAIVSRAESGGTDHPRAAGEGAEVEEV
jgi:Sec-independent protein translocase protein TatA